MSCNRSIKVKADTFNLIDMKAKLSGMKKIEVIEFAIKNTIVPRQIVQKKKIIIK